MAEQDKRGRGWHGDSDGHRRAGQEGGQATARKYGPNFYEEIGRKGGQKSPGKFKKGSTRAVEAGRKGGKSRQDDSERLAA